MIIGTPLILSSEKVLTAVLKVYYSSFINKVNTGWAIQMCEFNNSDALER